MKTTALGVLTILLAVLTAAVSYLKTGTADFGEAVTSITLGLGLIKAGDAPSKPGESSVVRCSPLMWVIAFAAAFFGLCSCVSTTTPDGTVTKAPDRGLIDRGIETGFRLIDRVFPKPEPVPPVAVPVVTPAK